MKRIARLSLLFNILFFLSLAQSTGESVRIYSPAPLPPKFFGFVSGFRYDCSSTTRILKAVANMETSGAGSLCPVGQCVGPVAYGLDAVLLAPIGKSTTYPIDSGQWGKIDNRNADYVVAVDPEKTILDGQVTFRRGKWMVVSGRGTMYHVNKKPPPDFLPPSPCAVNWFFAGQRRNRPPSGPRGTAWILRGFHQHQASNQLSPLPFHKGDATASTTPPLWVAVTPCANQTTCLGAPGTNRADLLIRTLPLRGGRRTPAYLPLTTAGIDVWSRKVGETNADARAWVIPAATAKLDRPGFLDLLGYTPPKAANAPRKLPWEETEIPLAEFDAYLTNTVSVAGPPPPTNQWLTTSSIPGFRFQGLLAGAPLVEANACPAETICFAKVATGVPEIVARILPKQSNGKLWPVLGKFATPTAQVWIEQIASKQVRYYELLARAADSPELTGVVDRTGFTP